MENILHAAALLRATGDPVDASAAQLLTLLGNKPEVVAQAELTRYIESSSQANACDVEPVALDESETVSENVPPQVSEKTEEPGPKGLISISGLARLGSLDDDDDLSFNDSEVTTSSDVGQQESAEDGAQEAGVDLILQLDCTSENDALSAARAVVASLAAKVGAYEPGEVTMTPEGSHVLMRAIGASEPWVYQIPAGAPVFDGMLPGRQGTRVVAVVAGEVDMNTMLIDLDGLHNAAVAHLEPVTTLVISLTRQDGAVFDDLSLDEPKEFALANLSARLGALDEISVGYGAVPSTRLISYRVHGGGPTDARTLAVTLAGWHGIVQFPHAGSVEASLVEIV